MSISPDDRASIDALRLADARWRAVIDAAVDGIIVIDSHGRMEAFNAAAERMFGYAEAEVIGQNVSLLMPEPDRSRHDGYIGHHLTTGEKKIIGIGRAVNGRRRDGHVFPLHLSVGEMLIDGERKFTGVLHDLTKRAELEDRLRASEAKWRAVIDSAIDGIIVIDARGNIETFNPAAAKMFCYAEDEVIGQNVKMLMPSPYRDNHDADISRYLSSGDARIIGTGRDMAGRRKDGTIFPLHISVGETITEGEHRFTGILHDLSARVELEGQLREQTALAKLGEMAAVIVHEVKNPLAGIRGAVQVIGGRLPAGNTDAPMMKEIVKRIDSLDAMMKDLLLFARPPEPKRILTDILALLHVTADLLKRDQAAEHVEIDITGTAPPVQADPEMLQMVIHNLLINAVQAMKGSGRIRVAVDAPGGACRIAITDAGPGIPNELRTKIFTPFFTTKSRGTGLGLPTAKSFVEAHNGRIAVECPPSGGTTVTIQLPAD